MAVSKEEAKLFLNKIIVVIHTDGSSAGRLKEITENSIILVKENKKTLVSLNSIEKIKEKEFL